MKSLSEPTVEQTALAQFERAGWRIARSPEIAPDTRGAELRGRL